MFMRIWKDESGGTLIFFGFAVIMLIAAVGCAVDMARAQTVRSKLSMALDAAGLAAGATINSTDVQTQANKFFNANFNSTGLGATVVSMTAVPNSDNTKINLNATVTLPTTLMNVLGYTSLTLTATSEITRTSKGMELVLVFDNTGSMNSSVGGGLSKLDAAKAAANNLLDILYGSSDTQDNLWVGLVPFSQAVNIGTSHTSWIDSTYGATLNWHGTSWAGCVDARYNGQRYSTTPGKDVTDDPPSVQLFKQYYWPDDGNNNWIYTTCTNYDHWGNCTASTTNYRYDSSHGPNLYCPQPITPMTASKATVRSSINAMTAAGNTHIVLGLNWSWNMLSPRWRGLWGGEMDTNSLPLNYNSPLMNKVVILMTDGDNTISNGSRGAYWYEDDGKLGTTNNSTAEAELNTRMSAVCTSMKATSVNIIIYTISFGTDVSSAAQTLLRNCASKPEYFFNSPTNSDLENAFHVIGDSLANLRVSQ